MVPKTLNPTISVIAGTILLLAVLVGIFLLAWHKILTGAETLGVIGTIVGLGAGLAGVKVASTSAVQTIAAASALPPARTMSKAAGEQ